MRYPYRNPWFQDDTRTGLVMPRGAGTFWGLGGPRTSQDLRHDRSKTILLVEVAEAAAPIWSEPRDIVIDPSNPKKDLGWHWRSTFFRNQKDKCCMAVFADGGVRYVPQRIADEELWFPFSGQGPEPTWRAAWYELLFTPPICRVLTPAVVFSVIAAAGVAIVLHRAVQR